tara:strand:+ start:29547 stop:30485 length:939 start_codon:yes stop_codon:yes gene_type:complete
MKLQSLLFISLILLNPAFAQNEVRTWTSADGRSFDGTLREVTERGATIRRVDGRQFTVPAASLSAQDQTFLREFLENKARAVGFQEGPYADAIQGEWQKFPKEHLGMVFQIYGTEKLRRQEGEVPLFVHLHGAGARADDVEAGKVEIAAQRLVASDLYQKDPCLLLVPLCPPDVSWGQQLKPLEAVIDDLVRKLPIDRDRIYLSGYSMGARGIGSLLESRPAYYAAAMFADGQAKPEWAETVEAAIWLWFSGERDMAGAEATANAFLKAEKMAHYEGFPELTHNQIHWKLAHDEEVFDWMFERRRGENKKAD